MSVSNRSYVNRRRLRHPPSRPTPQDFRVLERMIEGGAYQIEAAYELGVSQGTIQRWVARHGLTRRPRGWKK